MRLRKESGFPFTKCKSALEESDFDLSRAHSLLQEWAKADGSMLANKLAARSTKEGLLAVLTHKSQALLLEVNCETDFVSRNEVFQNFALNSLSSIFSSGCYKNAKVCDDKHVIDISVGDMTELTHLKTEVLPLLKENIMFGRCIKLEKHNGVSIYAAVHPKSTASAVPEGPIAQYGKFVSLVALKPKEAGTEVSPALANQLAYHVIGMSPQVLHVSELKPKEPEPPVAAPIETEDVVSDKDDQGATENADEFVEEEIPMPDDSPFSNMSEALLEQRFLFDPSKSIAEICDLNNFEIISFHRFELK